jgi:peroxiredoxin
MKADRSIFLVPILLFAAGCASKSDPAGGPVADADQFLRWSMNKYAGFKSFQGSVAWDVTSPNMKTVTEKRDISYAAPNKFRVATTAENGKQAVTVCDGTKAIEFVDGGGGTATPSDAPKTIALAQSGQMKHPLYNGTILYQFFGGSDNYDKLVKVEKGKPTFGADEKSATGEDAKTVKFYAQQSYGHVEALIGTKSGFVYRIKYDGEGEREELAKNPETKDRAAQMPHINATEVYSALKADAACDPKTFDTTPPKGVELADDSGGTKPPVPEGQPAPDVEFTTMEGQKVKLSSFKGKIVLIDFWATWCPPCRKGLPITNKMNELYASKGLQVVTVSNENAPKIAQFIKENKYTFPAFRDPSNDAARTYKVNGIPTMVIVDARGNLSSYSVGLEAEDDVVANLKKAGLKT